MKALLLAAGRSRRAKPIEDKNLLRYNGSYLIEHQMEAIKKAGVQELFVIGGEHNEATLKPLVEKHGGTFLIQENLDEGMAGALVSASKTLGADEPLFIVSGNDVVEQAAFEKMIQASQSAADAYLLAYEVAQYFPGGYLELDPNGRITSIVEKPGEGNEPSNLVNIVLHLFKNPQSLYDALADFENANDDRYELALDQLMKAQNFEAVAYDGYWQPIKHPWHALDLMEYFLRQLEKASTEPVIDPSAEVAKTAVLNGAVHIEAGAKVFDGAIINGPAYIGKNSIVASNALVRQSILGENCVVGFSTEVARSLIGDECWSHSNYIGDTVMGSNCSFGAGAVCANLRLDEKEIVNSGRNKLGPILGDDIRVGVNTSLMPGIRIGSRSFITSGITIAQDIEAGQFVSGKTELSIQPNRASLDGSAREAMRKKMG